jgi:ABC-2 type transport system permease protein
VSLGTVLRKELTWSRHRIVALLLILVLLPGAFAYGATFFQSVLPKDAPVAMVGGENVTEDDREVVRVALNLFSKPIDYDSREAAVTALERESIYAVVEVPPGIADRNVSQATVTVTIHGDVTPYREPSGALVSIVQRTLDQNLEKNVDVTRETLGPERKLSSYLLPTFLMILLMVLAFAYLPYNLANEERVIDRLRVETSLATVLAGKIIFFAALVTLPVVVFQAAAIGFGYDVLVVAPGALLAFLTTFVALAAVSAAVTLFTRFSTTGRLLNVLLLFGVTGFSGLVYPAGFFSPIRRQIVRLIPTHYAMLLARGAALKGHGLERYATWTAGLVAMAALATIPLWVAITEYERNA